MTCVWLSTISDIATLRSKPSNAASRSPTLVLRAAARTFGPALIGAGSDKPSLALPRRDRGDGCGCGEPAGGRSRRRRAGTGASGWFCLVGVECGSRRVVDVLDCRLPGRRDIAPLNRLNQSIDLFDTLLLPLLADERAAPQ